MKRLSFLSCFLFAFALILVLQFFISVQTIYATLMLPHVPLMSPSTTVPSETVTTLVISVSIEGLTGEDTANIQLLPGMEKTAKTLATFEKKLPQLMVTNGITTVIAENIPIGVYKLMINASSSYYREPQGYLFRVAETGIVRTSDLPVHFKLISPTTQTLPLCKNFTGLTTAPEITLGTTDIPSTSLQEVCIAEGIIDLSDPRNQLRAVKPEILNTANGDYYYIGPRTTQDNNGVWGQNRVVDTNIVHDGNINQFVAERVYADNGSNWIEAGWSEDSWKDEGQYIYVMDSVGHTSIYFPEYQLSHGSVVRTQVYYNTDINKWRALYYIGDDRWAVLREVEIGFEIADYGYNRGEAYTANGILPILPLSTFDEGYLLLDGVWRVWDTRYPTDVRQDPPYKCDMLIPYNRFNIHSPLVFLPLIIRE